MKPIEEILEKSNVRAAVNRVLQQSIAQVLTPVFEAEFQEHSYGFRPGRSCEQAVLQLMSYLNDGYEWIVDIDLEKFFDNVPQDKLMSHVGRVIHDPAHTKALLPSLPES
jgi:retron-type reverse transcriptase